ncbi:MAG: DNA translocase FtsK 4TM domain-containing protein [Chloroflexi bacterium]|nr:DNA translocase FtsK 4TM domain-containing protein [Chloroflexota bacterium]MCY3937402.1 DNA translocase FtsK 4TM domain-containing protein [Chloroflexota bacterium]
MSLPIGTYQIVGLVLTVISVLALIGLATEDGIVAGAVGGALAELFGRPAWLSVFVLLAIGVTTFASGFTKVRLVSAPVMAIAVVFVSALSGLTHLATGLGAQQSGPTGGGLLGRAVGWNMVVALGYPGAYTVLIILIVLVLAFALLRPGPGLGYVAALGRFVIEVSRSIRRLAVAAAVRLEARLRALEGARGKSANVPSRKRGAATKVKDDKWQQAPLIKVKSPPVQPADGNQVAAEEESETEDAGRWRLPPFDFLDQPNRSRGVTDEEIAENAAVIESTLASFNVEARVQEAIPGPVVTQYCVSPGSGVKVARITALANDLALALSAKSIRVEAPVPGRPFVGLEFPNRKPATVTLRELMESEEYQSMDVPLRLLVGKTVADDAKIDTLSTMPHLLIAGSTGAGKSVFLNSVILSLLFQHHPDELRLILIDPKMVELVAFNDIPHLMMPVVVRPDEVVNVLAWASREMGLRYKTLSDTGYRNLQSYNQDAEAEGREKMPYIVVIVDELADLMMTASADVERHLCRLAQMARAVGIHLIIATQRPSVDVLTGLIKANFPTRVAFMVSSQVDSRTILDSAGAERLVGRGDMLYSSSESSRSVRLQGAYSSDSEIKKVVKFWAKQGDLARITPEEVAAAAEEPDESEMELFEEAADIVRQHSFASAALLQRELQIGNKLARRLIEMLERQGLVGPPIEGRPSREVLTQGVLEPEEVA